jgi:hypothetical protein
VSFVSVTQQFNTTTSMGRLTLNVLLSFAQFEREVTSERIRDKIAASKRKGLWVGGPLPLGYHMKDDGTAIRKVRWCRSSPGRMDRLRDGGPSNGNGLPVRHFPGKEKAQRFATDREYRASLVAGKAWEKAKGK